MKSYLSVLFFVISLGATVELVARFALGLGDPPLSVSHPSIEYLFKPNQDVRRFGNRILINQYSMRSMDFPSESLGEDEIRVMVYGDSVINGGSLTDHADLATTLVQNRLTNINGENSIVGNASAGSWSIANVLFYIDEFGFMDADHAFFVFSSADVLDYPTYEPLDPRTHPTRKPFSATMEGLVRYLPRYLPDASNATIEEGDPIQREKAVAALRELLERAKNTTANVTVMHHPTIGEVESGAYEEGFVLLRNVALEHEAQFVELKQYYEALDYPKLYRDAIHINEAGQQLLADLLVEQITRNQ